MNYYDLIPESTSFKTELQSSTSTITWGWRDVWLLGLVFLVGAFFLAVTASLLIESGSALLFLQTLPPASGIAAIIIAIYGWLIFCIYLWIVRQKKSSWQMLGIRVFPLRWLIILPCLYASQLFVAGLVNLFLITLFLGTENK